MAAPLADRIREVLTKPAASADVAALLKEVEAAEAKAGKAAEAARSKALDPSLSDAEAQAAREEGDRLQFERDRLAAAIASLGKRVEQLRADEAKTADRGEYDAAKAERDALAKDLRERWPTATAELIGLLDRLRECDARIERANKLGAGEWLPSAEAEARGLELNWRNRNTAKSLLDTKIPAFDPTGSGPHDHGLAFPTSRVRLVG